MSICLYVKSKIVYTLLYLLTYLLTHSPTN